MTYDEFISALEKKYGKYTLLRGQETAGQNMLWERERSDRFEQEWRSGGTYGASCWNDAPSSFAVEPSDAPTDWPELDDLLQTYWHDISYLQYRMFINPLIKSDTRSDGDYYGNTTTYAIHYVKIADLFTLLQKNGKLS